jgi:hypothetical protein
MGIFMAIPIVIAARGDVLALPTKWHQGEIVGLIVLAGLGYWLYSTGKKRHT